MARTLLVLRRPPVVVPEYENLGRFETGDAYGTDTWRLTVDTGKYSHESGKRLFGVTVRWHLYREWLREAGWRSVVITIGWPRRIRRITFDWSNDKP